MIWYHNELKNDVETLFGNEQLELLSPCLKTIGDKGFYVFYHYNEVEKLIDKELKEIEPDNHELLQLRLREDSKSYKEVCIVLKKTEAHIIACLQSLHSLSDVMAHAIYYATKMGNNPLTRLNDWKITAYNVLDKFRLVPGTDSLKIKCDSLINNDEFKYLASIVNCSKHRNLITTRFWINLDQNKEYGMQNLEFTEFIFNERTHDQKRVAEFIKNEYSRIKPLVVEIGIEINNFVRNKLNEQSD